MALGALTPLSFSKVRINDAFWAPRIAANRERGLNAVYQQLRNTGRLQAYDLDWKPGSKKPAPHVFWDSDVAKWLEGACYSLMTYPNASLKMKVENLVNRILSAQGEDGYLNPHFTVVAPGFRWTNLRDQHELYCAGHLIEAAIAHQRATGDARFLAGMRRYADLINQAFGPGEDQRHGYPGHEEIELALVKLYRYTGEESYLNLASYFIEERGRSPHYFELEARARGEHPVVDWPQGYAYYQAHLPVRQQTEVVGHAVRAMYLFSGMADIALELGDESLFTTLKTLWEDLTFRKMYLTGGIGTSRTNEGFTKAYDLPNDSAYAETCAAIGLIFWAHRMLRIELDSRYADVMEKAMYNGMLSGVSLTGDRFFYVNPLASDGKLHRQAFFSCSCCPPNLNRLLPTIGEYIYSVGLSEIAVHLYIQSEADIELKDGAVTIFQQTDYPWDGIVCLQIKTEEPCAFTLKLRKPGWCREGRLYLNNELISQEGIIKRGYLSLTRTWQPDDQIRLQWVMPSTRVYAHPDVLADVGKVALMRGPLVYCLEAKDQIRPLHHLRLPPGGGFDSQYEPDLLGGVVSLLGTASAAVVNDWGTALYQQKQPRLESVPFKAIPYYAWGNRAPGEMSVWLPEE